MNAQNIFFQLPKLNKFCLEVELDPAHQVIMIKKFKMDHLWGYTLYSTSCRNGYRMSLKNKKGMPVIEILNTCT